MAQDHAVGGGKVNTWIRIPDGTKVRLREGGQEGTIDGLTELVVGPERNPDGKTQYRVNVGDQDRMLVIETALTILIDGEGLVMILKQKPDYRRLVTNRLRETLSADYFVSVN
ncbi:MAG TPA: hypothetical protein VIR79_06015 [Nitrospira sp.]